MRKEVGYKDAFAFKRGKVIYQEKKIVIYHQSALIKMHRNASINGEVSSVAKARKEELFYFPQIQSANILVGQIKQTFIQGAVVM